MEVLRSMRPLRDLEDDLCIRIEIGQDRQWAKWILETYQKEYKVPE